MKLQYARHLRADLPAVLAASTASAYNAAGTDYLAYADGNAARLFDFDSFYSFADREIWRRIDHKLEQMATDGRRTLRVLDAGCGPGTWLKRVLVRARSLGFRDIELVGFDLSPAMITLARESIGALADNAATVALTTSDITQNLPFADRHFDICLCLYGVLNHIATAEHARVAAELARVTLDTMFVTVRTAGSLPTIYVDGLEQARAFHQDNDADWMDVDLTDGRHLGFPSHLFRSDEFKALFLPHLATVAMTGLDIFHSRFATNPTLEPRRPGRAKRPGRRPGPAGTALCIKPPLHRSRRTYIAGGRRIGSATLLRALNVDFGAAGVSK